MRSHPDSPEIREWLGQLCNALAWELIAGAEDHRDPTRALPLARRAVAQKPDDTTYLTTLGLALYRTGGYGEAIPILESSLAASRDSTAVYDLFILSACHSRNRDVRPGRFASIVPSRSWSPNPLSTRK